MKPVLVNPSRLLAVALLEDEDHDSDGRARRQQVHRDRLDGSTTLRNTTVRNISDSARIRPSTSGTLARVSLDRSTIFAVAPPTASCEPSAGPDRGQQRGADVAHELFGAVGVDRRHRRDRQQHRVATGRRDDRGDVVVRGGGQLARQQRRARGVRAVERAAAAAVTGDHDLDRRQRARPERAREHPLALARGRARQRGDAEVHARAQAQQGDGGQESAPPRSCPPRGRDGASPPAPSAPTSHARRSPPGGRRAAASARAARPGRCAAPAAPARRGAGSARRSPCTATTDTAPSANSW